jgi:hypothetical protein
MKNCRAASTYGKEIGRDRASLWVERGDCGVRRGGLGGREMEKRFQKGYKVVFKSMD